MSKDDHNNSEGPSLQTQAIDNADKIKKFPELTFKQHTVVPHHGTLTFSNFQIEVKKIKKDKGDTSFLTNNLMTAIHAS